MTFHIHVQPDFKRSDFTGAGGLTHYIRGFRLNLDLECAWHRCYFGAGFEAVEWLPVEEEQIIVSPIVGTEASERWGGTQQQNIVDRHQPCYPRKGQKNSKHQECKKRAPNMIVLLSRSRMRRLINRRLGTCTGSLRDGNCSTKDA
jgi:hypothetical protein